MTTTLNEIELADRWGMSPKTLQRWRNLNVGPEYRKLGKKIMYPLADVEDYENLVRSNFAGIEEILLYLQHAGEASLEQIQAACLGGKQSRSCIQAYLQRLTQSSPPKVKAHMALQDPVIRTRKLCEPLDSIVIGLRLALLRHVHPVDYFAAGLVAADELLQHGANDGDVVHAHGDAQGDELLL